MHMQEGIYKRWEDLVPLLLGKKQCTKLDRFRKEGKIGAFWREGLEKKKKNNFYMYMETKNVCYSLFIIIFFFYVVQ